MDMPHRADYARLRTTGTETKLRVPKRSFVVDATATQVPCQYQRQTGREVRTSAGEKVLVDGLVLADVNPPWQASGRLLIAGIGTFEIVDVDPDVAERGHHSETLVATTTRRS